MRQRSRARAQSASEHLAQRPVKAIAFSRHRISRLVAAHDHAALEVAHELAVALHRHQDHGGFVFARSGANCAQHLACLASLRQPRQAAYRGISIAAATIKVKSAAR
jgi:hypothetical protein